MKSIAQTDDLSDLRREAIQFGLNQLTDEQLQRILTHNRAGKAMCCDTFNYDVKRGLWCPLAIGLDVPRLAKHERPTCRNNSWGKSFITEVGQSSRRGFTLNPISGVPGNFFRNNREADIVKTCKIILAERASMRIAA
jgi:hypothetical protein